MLSVRIVCCLSGWQVRIQEFLDPNMVKEFRMGAVPYTHLKNEWVAARGYCQELPASVLEGHGVAEFRGDAPTSEGWPIVGAVDFTRDVRCGARRVPHTRRAAHPTGHCPHDTLRCPPCRGTLASQVADGRLVITGGDRREHGKPLRTLRDVDAASRPALRPPARSYLDTEAPFEDVNVTTIGHAASVGPIISGVNWRFGRVHAYIVGDDGKIYTFLDMADQKPDMLAKGEAYAYALPKPTPGLHPDIAHNKAMPRHEVCGHCALPAPPRSSHTSRW
jgi:hypothetical protein